MEQSIHRDGILEVGFLKRRMLFQSCGVIHRRARSSMLRTASIGGGGGISQKI